MITINIDNRKIEDFYKYECNNDSNKLIEKFLQYIEYNNIKGSIKKGFEEMKLQKDGKLEKVELRDVLNEL